MGKIFDLFKIIGAVVGMFLLFYLVMFVGLSFIKMIVNILSPILDFIGAIFKVVFACILVLFGFVYLREKFLG